MLIFHQEITVKIHSFVLFFYLAILALIFLVILIVIFNIVFWTFIYKYAWEKLIIIIIIKKHTLGASTLDFRDSKISPNFDWKSPRSLDKIPILIVNLIIKIELTIKTMMVGTFPVRPGGMKIHSKPKLLRNNVKFF